MAFDYENLVNIIEEYKLEKNIQPLLSLIKATTDCKQRIAVDVNDYHGQQYCHVLSGALKRCQKVDEDSDLINTICDALLDQVTYVNVRWFLLDQCHVLDILVTKFFSSSNQSVQIKIAKTIQLFLIHSQDEEGKTSINQLLVSQLFKQLVDILQDNYPQEYTEASLGLLASLCQIWANCQQVMNVIEDYQILRKQLLRFLSTEMVKRTTIAYTMTIMFHLCNSDDRLFNKRNIRQTLQVLFNIMLNGDTEWASLYAARLLTEICRSTRTCHLLTEYRSLSVSLKSAISQISGKEKIVIEKHLEFISVLTRVSSEYRHLVMEVMIPIEDSEDPGKNSSDIINSIISLINDSESSIATHALTLLDEVYTEYLRTNDGVKLLHLHNLGDAIHQVLSSATCNMSSNDPHDLHSDADDADFTNITRHISNRNHFVNLTKIKCIIQLITNLLMSGDVWLDQVSLFLNNTDRIIKEQIDSNALNYNVSLIDPDLTMSILSLGVEVFIGALYFYYRATEIRPSSFMFGERLKSHLEQPKCPIMLGFALSAATQNQSILQRALVLQGVCLHLQDFNVELMGEKMYQFSSEFTALKLQVPSLDEYLDNNMIIPKRIKIAATESADGDNELPQDNNYNKLQIPTSNQIVDTYLDSHDAVNLHISKSKMLNKYLSNKPSGEQHLKKSLPTKERISQQYFDEPSISSGDQIDKVNLEMKVQQIVNKWISRPETKFSTNEIYCIFEHRIQSMQNQETLINEIIANKTAALHQSEALLNQYRNKLTAADKESKQFRSIQVEMESKIDSLNKRSELQQCKIVEMEKINQNLMDSNRMGDKHKEECLTISKKLQERLVKISEEKSKLQMDLETCMAQLEESQREISQKDIQIANYSQITKLINKLTGNKFTMEGCSSHFNLEDLNKCLNSPSRFEYESYSNTNNNSEMTVVPACTSEPITTPYDNADQSASQHAISASDFLQLYKVNSRFLQNQK